MKNLIKIILGVLVFCSVLVSCEEYELYEGEPITRKDYQVIFDYDFGNNQNTPKCMDVYADRIFNASKYYLNDIDVNTGLSTKPLVTFLYNRYDTVPVGDTIRIDTVAVKDSSNVALLANGSFKFLTIQHDIIGSKDSLILDFSNFDAKRKNSKTKTWDLMNTQLRSIPISKSELYARFKKLNIDMLDSKWSDGNSYTSYVMSALTPLYVDSVQVMEINRGVENHVAFTPTNIFQHIKLNFNVGTEAGENIEGISIKGIVAEISGVPAGINPYNRQVDIRSTYKVLAKCKTDNGILYSADYDVIGLGYGKKAYSNGPGYLQVIINYTATKNGVTKEYTSTSVPISLYNVIKAANILTYDVENEDIAVQNGSNFVLNLIGTVTLSVTDASASSGTTNSGGCKITLK